MSKPYADREVWFLTGSQNLYGEETLRQVAAQSQEVARLLDASPDVPAPIVWKPVLKDPDSIRRAMIDASSDDRVIGVITWMHTFSPSKMWINGLEQLRKPLLHLHTQANVELPWSTIDFDFMNLNQAAHGDREHGYIQSRMGVPRTTVAGHVSNPAVAARVGTWVRAARGRGRDARHEGRALRRQHALRRGDRGRQDRGRDPVRRLGQHVGRQRARRRGRGRRAARRSTRWSRSTRTCTTSCPSCARAGSGTSRCATRAAQEVALRAVPRPSAAATAFTDTFEDLGALRQLPGHRRPAADGQGLRLRRRGRLEDGGPGARGQGDGRRPARRREPHGGLHLRPDARATSSSSARTCWRSARR